MPPSTAPGDGQKLIATGILDDPEALRRLVKATLSGAPRPYLFLLFHSMSKNLLGLETALPGIGQQATRRLKDAGFPVGELAAEGINYILRYVRAMQSRKALHYSQLRLSERACDRFLKIFLDDLTPAGFPQIERITQKDLLNVKETFRPKLQELIKWQKASGLHQSALLAERASDEKGVIGSPPWHRAMGEFEQKQDAKRKWRTQQECERATHETSSGKKRKYLAHQLYEYASGRGIPDVQPYMDKAELCNKIVTHLNTRGDTKGDVAEAARVAEEAARVASRQSSRGRRQSSRGRRQSSRGSRE